MEDKFKYVCTAEDEQYQIKDILRHNFEFSSRLRTKLKQNNSIYLNGEPTLGWHTPKAGDVISVRLPSEVSSFEPEDIPVYPLYEDEDILIINKQPGVVVHPTRGQPNHTLANALQKYMNDTGQEFKIRFVNRLDRDTSGVLIVAKNSYSQEELTKQMKANTTRKYYAACVCGMVEKDSGTVDLPIGRPDPERIERGVLPVEEGGFPSATHYKVLERKSLPTVQLDSLLTVDIGFCEGPVKDFTEEELTEMREQGLVKDCSGYTVLELLLETGRTHQIRVHMGALGHHIVGDSLYGGVLCRKPEGKDFYSPITRRQLLHAKRIEINHPVTKERMIVEAPLPADFNF